MTSNKKWARLEKQWYLDYSYDDELVATVREPLRETNGGLHWLVTNERYMCPTCGSVWGYLLHLAPKTYNRGSVRWRAVERPCHEHGGGNFIDYNSTLPDPYINLPPSLIEYEATIALENFDG